MSDQWKRKEIEQAFFAVAGHVNRNHAFQNKTKNKCNDRVRCEKLEAFQHNKDFFKTGVFFNVHV